MATKRYNKNELVELVRSEIAQKYASPELINQVFGKRTIATYTRLAKSKGHILTEIDLENRALNVAKGAFDRLGRITDDDIIRSIPKEIKDNCYYDEIDISIYKKDFERAAKFCVGELIRWLMGA